MTGGDDPSASPSPSSSAEQDPEIGGKVAAVWDANAAFWDARMGEGNLTHRTLVAPTMERLLQLRKGEVVLDIACGNGQFARRLAELGATVVAVDLSGGMLAHARARSAQVGDRIDFRRLDATDPAALDELGRGRFAAVVSAMALMDMTEIAPLARALPSLLAPGGRFVFAVTHPAFNGTGMRRMIEEEDVGGTMVQRSGVVVFRYGTPTTAKGLAMVGQPEPQYYFDRPLNELLRPFFAAGLAVDALEEPRFGPDLPTTRPLSWAAFTEIPSVLVVRMRLLGSNP
ncbi:MAG: class I SAM-dependent methyltransferase [Thermoplasmata archaeon]|nr:class I SAM-dependent methyltransferase [Thermoplasmata archaeon]